MKLNGSEFIGNKVKNLRNCNLYATPETIQTDHKVYIVLDGIFKIRCWKYIVMKIYRNEIISFINCQFVEYKIFLTLLDTFN